MNLFVTKLIFVFVTFALSGVIDSQLTDVDADQPVALAFAQPRLWVDPPMISPGGTVDMLSPGWQTFRCTINSSSAILKWERGGHVIGEKFSRTSFYDSVRIFVYDCWVGDDGPAYHPSQNQDTQGSGQTSKCLTIDRSVMEDQDDYSCKATVSGRLSTATVNVRVAPAMTTQPIRKHRIIMLEESSTLAMSCHDMSRHHAVTWQKLKPSGIWYRVASGNLYSIARVSLTHAGNYSCTTNHKPISYANFTILIIEEPAIIFERPAKESYQIIGKCSIETNSAQLRRLYWMKENSTAMQLSFDKEDRVTQMKYTNLRINITAIILPRATIREDYGRYWCIAEWDTESTAQFVDVSRQRICVAGGLKLNTLTFNVASMLPVTSAETERAPKASCYEYNSGLRPVSVSMALMVTFIIACYGNLT